MPQAQGDHSDGEQACAVGEEREAKREAHFLAPVVTPKGVISSEIVLYKGQRLKFPADAGIWYIRWEEGHKPKWQRADSISHAIHLRVRKQYELQAISVGIEVKTDNPSRLRFADALQQYIEDQKLLSEARRLSPLTASPHKHF